MSRMLQRNIHAGELLETFMVTAIASLLLMRFYLFVTGYPQIGGRLHIAHMLYGGLLMAAAIVLTLIYLTERTRRLSAILGGIGFGIFIDELGKFITRDNNYFFRPTAAILYALFLALFFLFRRIARNQELSSTEYLLNALHQMEEVVLNDLDEAEKKRTEFLLFKAGNNPTAKALLSIIDDIKPLPIRRQLSWRRFKAGLLRFYTKLAAKPAVNRSISFFLIAQATLFAILSAWSLVPPGLGWEKPLSADLAYASYAQLTALLISLLLMIRAARNLSNPVMRLSALEMFKSAVLVNLFVVQFVGFYLHEFRDIPVFVFQLLLYIGLDITISQERLKLAAHPNTGA
ncbi:MAG TPA: hypothetical protein VLF21_00755 [Candidatus Saccharimonadales bacterium]|nr:hypothetical protein [Candidatus Saccharimonadales bacterium]